ncbi:MAG: hypothetical protein E6H66_00630 [Betaproteobacteria bacterium]|nr:MAG: hypothetical protein E6H66_00630 [Betaproteobacteria bacterium]
MAKSVYHERARTTHGSAICLAHSPHHRPRRVDLASQITCGSARGGSHHVSRQNSIVVEAVDKR